MGPDFSSLGCHRFPVAFFVEHPAVGGATFFFQQKKTDEKTSKIINKGKGNSIITIKSLQMIE